MKNLVGIMQGRLLPKYQGRYQAHPFGSWQEEFPIAKEVGLDCIEFILDYNDADINPLLKTGGVEEIQAVTEKTGVQVKTICADYFMEAPMHIADSSIAENSVLVMKTLLNTAASLGVSDIVIPCVDQSSLNGKAEADRFVKVISSMLDLAESNNINFSLETDLAPEPFYKLIERFGSQRITVNYDIGNSASLGFNPIEELDAYGDRLSDIHIKDRTRGGGPVTLGEGDADFDAFFTKLKNYNYQGPFIFQAYRDEEGVEIFKRQYEWTKKYFNQL